MMFLQRQKAPSLLFGFVVVLAALRDGYKHSIKWAESACSHHCSMSQNYTVQNNSKKGDIWCCGEGNKNQDFLPKCMLSEKTLRKLGV
jgi:hypothetical protein